MEINIKKSVLDNIKGISSNELKSTIDEAIKKGDTALPGLGVLFEIYYSSLSNKESFLKEIERIVQ